MAATRRRYVDELAELGVPGRATPGGGGTRRQRGESYARGRAGAVVARREACVRGERARAHRAGRRRAIVSVVIDRTFVDEQGVRWIVDYKSSSHEGADLDGFLASEQERYRPQLERYAALMRHLGPEPIRLGLYFPLLSAWRSWLPPGR